MDVPSDRERELAFSIVELAETIKDLCRLISDFPNYKKLSDEAKFSLDKVYKKASEAKNRVDWQ